MHPFQPFEICTHIPMLNMHQLYSNANCSLKQATHYTLTTAQDNLLVCKMACQVGIHSKQAVLCCCRHLNRVSKNIIIYTEIKILYFLSMGEYLPIKNFIAQYSPVLEHAVSNIGLVLKTVQLAAKEIHSSSLDNRAVAQMGLLGSLQSIEMLQIQTAQHYAMISGRGFRIQPKCQVHPWAQLLPILPHGMSPESIPHSPRCPCW